MLTTDLYISFAVKLVLWICENCFYAIVLGSDPMFSHKPEIQDFRKSWCLNFNLQASPLPEKVKKRKYFWLWIHFCH